MTLSGPTTSSFSGLLGLGDRSAIDRQILDEAFHDLGLDHVFDEASLDVAVRAAIRGVLGDEQAVRNRQSVFRDFESEPIRTALTDLADATRRAVANRRGADKTRQLALRNRLYLTAVLDYVAALDHASVALRSVTAPALIALAEHIRALCLSTEFAQLRTRSHSLEERWRAIRFTLQVQGAQVVVAASAGEPDLTAEVKAALAPLIGAPAPERRVEPGNGLLGHSLGSRGMDSGHCRRP